MRRRVFLRSVGAAAAGVAVGVGARRAHAAESPLAFLFGQARRSGKPLLVASGVLPETFARALAELGRIRDLELAVRVKLIAMMTSDGADDLRSLTSERPNIGPPSLTLIDGEPARLIAQAKLVDRREPKREVERFVRALVPLTAAWLRPRVAHLSRIRPDEVNELRRSIAAGESLGPLAQDMPAVIALEAVARKGAARARLFEDIVLPTPPLPGKEEDAVDCGLGALVLTGLGARFADLYTKPSRPGDERERKA